jgi:hypothetical protein
MQHLWCIRKLKVNLKIKCYSAHVLPILMVGSESWALTKKQANHLEVVHSHCLGQILGVRRCDRHRLTDVSARCGTVSLAEMLKAGRLRWLGHVLRMGPGEAAQAAPYVSVVWYGLCASWQALC